MDDFAHSTSAPEFDSTGIVRRTRRRRGVLALAASAAVVAAVTLTVTLGSSPKPTVSAAAAATTGDAMSSAPAAGQAVGTPGSAACHTATDPDADPAKNTITVPDLLGMSKEKATAVLRAAGLDIAVGSVNRLPGGPCFPKEHANLIGPDGLLPPGVVGFTSPVSGTKVAPGTMIGVMITRE